MKDKCPLDIYFPKDKHIRAIDHWGDCGTVVGWSKPIKLPHPYKNLKQVGGYWLFKRDRDNSEGGTDPKMITICKECPKNCPKK